MISISFVLMSLLGWHAAWIDLNVHPHRTEVHSLRPGSLPRPTWISWPGSIRGRAVVDLGEFLCRNRMGGLVGLAETR